MYSTLQTCDFGYLVGSFFSLFPFSDERLREFSNKVPRKICYDSIQKQNRKNATKIEIQNDARKRQCQPEKAN